MAYPTRQYAPYDYVRTQKQPVMVALPLGQQRSCDASATGLGRSATPRSDAF